jgi:hypothetical protein
MQRNKQTDEMKVAKEMAGKIYHPENQDNGEELTMTHEQVENMFKDGTIDMVKNTTEKK